MNVDKVQFYKNDEGEWRWRFIDSDGRTQAESVEAFPNRSEAVLAAERVCGLKLEFDHEERVTSVFVFRSTRVGVDFKDGTSSTSTEADGQ